MRWGNKIVLQGRPVDLRRHETSRKNMEARLTTDLCYSTGSNWSFVELFKDVFERALEDLLDDILGMRQVMGFPSRM